jgi:hypothetical protein
MLLLMCLIYAPHYNSSSLFCYCHYNAALRACTYPPSRRVPVPCHALSGPFWCWIAHALLTCALACGHIASQYRVASWGSSRQYSEYCLLLCPVAAPCRAPSVAFLVALCVYTCPCAHLLLRRVASRHRIVCRRGPLSATPRACARPCTHILSCHGAVSYPVGGPFQRHLAYTPASALAFCLVARVMAPCCAQSGAFFGSACM